MSLGGVALRRGAKLLLKRGLKMKGEVKDEVSEAKTRLTQLSDFPVQLVFELPEEETAEEKPNMGLVKLKDLPAIDGFASHGMFAREGRTPEPSNFSCGRRPAKAAALPSALVGIWSDVGRLIASFSLDLQELLGQLVPAQMVSEILEKKAPLMGHDLPPGELPFDISKHPACRHAEKSLSRWSEDMAFFRERAANAAQYSLKMKMGGQWPSMDALSHLQQEINHLKDTDEAAVAEALSVLLKAAGFVDDSKGEAQRNVCDATWRPRPRRDAESLRFTLLRYCGQEPEIAEGRVRFTAEEIDETEAFGGLDSCSGVRCNGDGLIGLKTYDWKHLGEKMQAKLPLLVAIIMGLQHSLAMLGGIITQYMISAALIASGLLSLVQILRWKLIGGYTLGTGLISAPWRSVEQQRSCRWDEVEDVMGVSFTFLPIAREVVVSEIAAGNSGKDAYGKFLGTCLVASLTEIFISFVPPRILKKLFPPVVSGTCVTLIGAGLIGSGIKYWGGGVFCAENDMSRSAAFGGPQMCSGNGDVVLPYGAPEYIGLGFSVMIFLIFIQAVGSPFLKNCSVALALFFGYFCAGVAFKTDATSGALAFVNTNKIDAAGTFTFLWTTTFNIGFYPPAFLPLVLGFVITSVETVGDIQATCDVSGLPLEGPDADSRIQGGLLADGLNSILAVLMTSPPNTTFSQNNGVIAITRCASRAAGIACCIWLILFGCFEKFGACIASIPDCVLGGMTTFLFANVFVSGINIVGAGGMGRRTRHAALRDGLGMDENRPHVRPMKSGEPAKSNFKID
ncbi:unnamed protein product [Durusdinium trenchii]|uniref:Uncharacterized protein n=1 Tax=Durusdinium trenchii TaxID=1381693 RepID=A0ABP0HRW2_9DINO